MPKLTKSLVDSTAPNPNGEVWVWDTEVEGFGLRVQPSGRKVYIVRYRVQDTKRTQRKQTICRASDMPPDRARDLARKIFAQVAEGLDPMKERQQDKDAPTVMELKERYMHDHAKPFKKPASVILDESNWRLHILPALGSKCVKEVTKANILTLVGKMADKKGSANQCIALLSKAFNLAEDWGWRDRNTNPCYKVKKYVLKEREMILTHEQIKILSETANRLAAENRISIAMCNMIHLLMLTGCRLREIMHARQEWIDRDRSLLILPDSKTGKRHIALSPSFMEIIDSMPKGQEWIIPGRIKGAPMETPYKAWKLIKAEAGISHELRIHDLRHTAGSLGHMAGLTQKQIQIMLGHKQIGTTARYLHGASGDAAVVAEKMGNVIVGAFGKKAA